VICSTSGCTSNSYGAGEDGKEREAISQYYFATDLQYKQSDTAWTNPRGVQADCEADQEMEADVEKIRGMLEDNVGHSGAVSDCEFEIFHEIYSAAAHARPL
jgi:hypothetical protein